MQFILQCVRRQEFEEVSAKVCKFEEDMRAVKDALGMTKPEERSTKPEDSSTEPEERSTKPEDSSTKHEERLTMREETSMKPEKSLRRPADSTDPVSYKVDTHICCLVEEYVVLYKSSTITLQILFATFQDVTMFFSAPGEAQRVQQVREELGRIAKLESTKSNGVFIRRLMTTLYKDEYRSRLAFGDEQ